MLSSATPLSTIAGISPRFLQRLKKLNIESVQDLVWHLPFRYEDFSEIYPVADLEPGQQATIQGKIKEISARRSWQRRLSIVEAIVEDDTGEIRAVWFNQPYIKNILREGRIANLSGKVTASEGELYLSHPTYELVGRTETRHTARLVPIYPETRGLTSKGLRFILQPILKNLEELSEWLPASTLEENDLPEINQAIRDVHFPGKIEDALAAKKRFAFENLFLLQLWNAEQKLKLSREKAPAIVTDIELLKKIAGELPFTLTESQKRSLWEILEDMERPTPMNRLLQGDVGSGKTVVAALAAVVCAKSGYQTAFMAPTEVLAQQHFETLKDLFKGIEKTSQPTLGILTSSGTKLFYENDLEETAKKEKALQKIKTGEVQIVVGTHSLIQRSVAWKNLGFVIVDEQHRFGVEQRATLLKTGSHVLPHFLSMSATPIPRTLMLTIFGDLDISIISELPKGRKNIITKVVPPESRDKAYEFIRSEIKKGRQIFVICPRIDPQEKDEIQDQTKIDLKSVKEEFEKLSKRIFPDLKIGMLHGQMKPKEKEKIMKDFKAREFDLLVATSVIEVGVDVPNATIMMIEGSDRFGLAQLYQFRGRVGRGAHQSFCFLFTDLNSRSTKERLKAILEAKNGFELAEKDLKIRGPGEFIGQKQTGLPDTVMAGLENVELIKMSRESAFKVVSEDPQLTASPALKEKLHEFERRIHLE